MTVTYTDTFTAANGTLLSAHTADTGQTYTAASEVTIENNGIARETGTYSTLINIDQTQTYTDSYIIECDVILQEDSTSSSGPAACFAAANNGYYYCRFNSSTDVVNLSSYQPVVGFTTIGTWSYGARTGETTVRLGLHITPTHVNVLVDGVERISVADTDVARTGDVGFRLFNADDTLLDNAEYDSDPVFVPTIAPADPMTDGATGLSLNKQLFTESLTGVTVDGIATTFTQTTYDNINILTAADGAQVPDIGTVTVTASGATESDSVDIENEVQDNYSVTTLTTVDTGTSGNLYGLMLGQLAITLKTNDWFYFPLTSGDETGTNSISSDSSYDLYDFPVDFVYVDSATKQKLNLTMTTGGEIVPTGRSALTRNITRPFTRNAIEKLI